jgi:hypothetical protein
MSKVGLKPLQLAPDAPIEEDYPEVKYHCGEANSVELLQK